MHDFEWWEIIYELKQEEDWPGLIRYYQKEVRHNPDDYYAQVGLGEAYLLNGEYQKAIDYLAEVHREIPESEDPQHFILKALFALGKDENDFDWVEKPVVLRLNEEVLERCYQYLRPKRKPRDVYEIYTGLERKAYLTFDREALYEALKEDERFKVEGPFGFDSKVSVL
jgi:tetratricopeptide (TPR) repeat protein